MCFEKNRKSWTLEVVFLLMPGRNTPQGTLLIFRSEKLEKDIKIIQKAWLSSKRDLNQIEMG